MGGAASVLDIDSQKALFSDLIKIYEEEKGEEKGCYNRMQKKINEVLPPPPKLQQSGGNNNPKGSIHSIISLNVGDVVKVFDDGFYSEGVIVDRIANQGLVKVDLGDSSSLFKESECALVVAATDFEVGDKVEVRPEGTALFFTGHIININHIDGTFDVTMDGDNDDDIEYGVTPANIRKVMTSRNLALERWKKAMNRVTAMRAFIHLGHLHHLKDVELHAHDHDHDQ